MLWLLDHQTSIVIFELFAGPLRSWAVRKLLETCWWTPIRASYRAARACRACLLAWLILVLAAPIPSVLAAGVGYPWVSVLLVRTRGPDTGRERNAQDDGLLTESVFRQVRVLSRLDASRPDMEWPRARHPFPRFQQQTAGSHHFLADGRRLRLCLRSLTC